MKKFITTPIFYVNAKPHLGHAFTMIIADFLAKYYKIKGYTVFFLTGTDEHGQKIEEAANKKNISPQDFVDQISNDFKEAWKKLDINYDFFIRTTDKEHEKIVQDIFQKLYENGDLYKGVYKGKYCVACESYYGDDELIDGKLCPIHKKPVIEMEEESYFFKLSKYQKFIEEYLTEKLIFPAKFKNDLLERVKKGLRDVSVSRKNLKWGIKLPFDNSHVIYVWFDALLNYYTAAKINNKLSYWPPINIIGKDILWFHAIYWPAILKALNLSPPRLYIHGWWTVEGEKMSKTLGNVIDIDKLVNLGLDESRYFLLRQMPYGEDSDFSEKMFNERYDEILNNISNLVYRVSKICEKNKLSLKGKVDKNIKEKIIITDEEVFKNIENFKVQAAMQKIMEFAKFLNKYINDNEPWKLIKEDKEKTSEILFNLVYAIEYLHLILYPIMPHLMKEVKEIFSFDDKTIPEYLNYIPKEYALPKPKMLLKRR